MTDTQTKFDFGVTDRLGRAIGYAIVRLASRYGNGRGDAGLYFNGCATRNGNYHQASTTYGPFATEADRDAKITEVVKNAQRRALAPAARLKA